MTEPNPTYTAEALRAAFETAPNGVVRIPAGVYEIDRPLRIPRPIGVVRGDGPRSSVIRCKPGVRTPLLVGLAAEADVSPVTPDGLAYGDRGWFSLLDGGIDLHAKGRFTVDVTATLPVPAPDVYEHYPVFGWCGQFHVRAGQDVPLRLSYLTNGSLLVEITTEKGYVRFESATGVVPFGRRVRFVVQYDDPSVRVWVVTDVSTLAVDRQWGGTMVTPRWCDLTVGEMQDRFPEGGGWWRPKAGTVFHRAAAKAFALYDVQSPPTGTDPADDLLGVCTTFASPDGAFFRGKQASEDVVFWWRHDPGDVPNHQVEIENVGVFGGSINVLVSNTHNWSAKHVHAGDNGRYGFLCFRQCYGGRLESLSVGALPGVGVALVGNSPLCTLADCHLETCAFGLVAEDVHLTGGWIDNCYEAHVVVTGDNPSLVAEGVAFGSEGAAVNRGLVLANCQNAVFTGCAFGFLTSPVPAVEFVGSIAGVFVGPRFGAHPATPALLKFVSHDPARPCRVVGEGRRWDRTSDAVPLVAGAEAGNVVVS